MPFAVEMAVPNRYVLVRLTGKVGLNDIAGALHDFADLAEEQSEPLDAIWDCRWMRELILDEADVAEIVKETRLEEDRAGPGRTSFIMSRDDDALIGALILRLARDGVRERRVFMRLRQALEWHGASEAEAELLSARLDEEG